MTKSLITVLIYATEIFPKYFFAERFGKLHNSRTERDRDINDGSFWSPNIVLNDRLIICLIGVVIRPSKILIIDGVLTLDICRSFQPIFGQIYFQKLSPNQGKDSLENYPICLYDVLGSFSYT